MKLSVIIPVYNVEKYLPKCLDSVICQNFDDMEIICINDGSTDNSLEILQNYAQKDTRIVVIDKQNEGVSTARNLGLERAKGDYIMFVDSDDYLEPEACITAYSEITKSNADIGVFSNFEFNGENRIALKKTNLLKSYAQNSENIDYSRLQLFIWDKIYKKSFLNDNKIKFPAGIKNAEDVIFNWTCFFKNPKYCFIDKNLYNYFVNRENSATLNCKDCIKNDLEALKYLCSTEGFKIQPQKIKLSIAERFCKGAIYYWDKFYAFSSRKILLKDIKNLIQFIDSSFEKNDLKKLKYYKKLKNIYLYTISTDLFSIKNINCYKIVSVLGFRFRLNRKSDI